MDYPSAGSGTTGNDSLVYAQWEAIHNPALIGKMFQSDEDGAYIDYCFSDQDNYKTFIDIKKDLIRLPFYLEVFSYINNSTVVSFCFNETENDNIGGGTSPRLLDSNLEGFILRNKYTGKKRLIINEILNNNIFQNVFFDPEKWIGTISLNMKYISKEVIFHELNHAAQLMLQQLNSFNYHAVKMEIETRLILFYSVFLLADEAVQKDWELMRDELVMHYDDNIIKDLYPLLGHMYNLEGKECFGYSSEIQGEFSICEDRYNLVYSYFSNRGNSSVVDDFNKYMLDYQRWLYVIRGYDKYWQANDYSRTDFEYYLLNKLENGTLTN
jgi:hypothetical protein